ncbi:TPR-like protein [Lentinula edodes]|uniref:TPR-like protein n=1 Tax=Lentinula edodes TaxID=5353 RepID=A0A1Q3EJC5_LENED|nr:TPR-like protein [Lentinula edodes]
MLFEDEPTDDSHELFDFHGSEGSISPSDSGSDEDSSDDQDDDIEIPNDMVLIENEIEGDFNRLVQDIRQRNDPSLAKDWDIKIQDEEQAFKDDLREASGVGKRRKGKPHGSGVRYLSKCATKLWTWYTKVSWHAKYKENDTQVPITSQSFVAVIDARKRRIKDPSQESNPTTSNPSTSLFAEKNVKSSSQPKSVDPSAIERAGSRDGEGGITQLQQGEGDMGWDDQGKGS